MLNVTVVTVIFLNLLFDSQNFLKAMEIIY